MPVKRTGTALQGIAGGGGFCPKSQADRGWGHEGYPAGPEAQQFVLDYLKDMTMHEVGHTLGLRHNFRASHGVPAGQVADPERTRTEAFTNSPLHPSGNPRTWCGLDIAERYTFHASCYKPEDGRIGCAKDIIRLDGPEILKFDWMKSQLANGIFSS